MDEMLISDGTAQKGVGGPVQEVCRVRKAFCLEAYEMLEEIALTRAAVPGRREAAQEAWRRITTYLSH